MPLMRLYSGLFYSVERLNSRNVRKYVVNACILDGISTKPLLKRYFANILKGTKPTLLKLLQFGNAFYSFIFKLL